MRKITLIGFYSLLALLIGCGQSAKKATIAEMPENWKMLNEPNYTIQYPDSFVVDTSGNMGMSFILLSKQTSQEDLFKENLNLVIQDLGGQNIDLDTYVKISEEQIKSLITDGNLMESVRIMENNTELHRIIYTGKQGQFNFKWQQRYWIANNKAYVLTLTCEEDQYNTYAELAEAIVKTFKIK